MTKKTTIAGVEFPVLDMSAPDFAEQFAAATGIEVGETIQIITPQFEREDGKTVPMPVGDARRQFESLASSPPERLTSLGLRKWDAPDANGNSLWLLPHEWYDIIPEGFVLECIDGTSEPFKRGVTDDDHRFGVLAYGIRAQAESRS